MYRLFILFFVVFIESNAQSDFKIDPRSTGRASTYSTETGSGSTFVNPGGTASLKTILVVVAGQNVAGVHGLTSSGIGVVLPTAIGVASISYITLGDEYLSQSLAALTLAQKLGIAQLGLRPGLSATSIQGHKSIYNFLLDFSGIVQLHPLIQVGAGIFNLTQSKYGEEDPIPVTGNIGIDINPITAFHLVVEAEKDLSKKPEYKAGCSYQIKDRVEILTGITTNPLRQSFGLALSLKMFKVQWSVSNLPGLGSKQAISISYSPKKRNV